MAILQSRIDPSSEAFRANRRDMLALVEGFRALEARVRDTSNQKLPMFQKRGQLTPRQRLAHLIDRGSPFLELSTLAGLNMHDDDGAENIMGGGTIAGIGYVSGVRAMITASDSGIKGGTIAPMGLKKSLRVQEIALRCKLPLIGLVESGGANLNYQAEIFVDGGRTFANMARLSAAGIPHITVVHGSSTAGGAYHPGLSDYVVVVKKRSKIFLAGPPLLKAATGEIATDEELGGAEMHTMVSGVAEYLAEDDADALRIAREIMAAIPWNERLPPLPRKAAKEPRYSPDELCGVVPVDYRKPYDVREVIARLVDDSDFLDFKPLYGAQTVCGQAVDRRRGRRHHRQQRPDRRRGLRQGRAVHPAVRPGRHAARVPAEHHRLHGRPRRRARRHRQARLQDDPGRRQRARAASSRCTSAPASAPATTACAGAPTTRASSSPGPTTASP